MLRLTGPPMRKIAQKKAGEKAGGRWVGCWEEVMGCWGSWHASFGCGAGFERVTPPPAPVFPPGPAMEKRDDFKVGKGHTQPFGAAGGAGLGATASLIPSIPPPSIPLHWLLLDKREAKPTGPTLDSIFLAFISFHIFSSCWCCPSFPSPTPHLSMGLFGVFFFTIPSRFGQQSSALAESQPQGQAPALSPFHVTIF